MIWRISGREKRERWKVEHTRIKLSKLSSKSVGLRVINIEHHWQWCSWKNILHNFGVAQKTFSLRKIRIKIKRFPMFKRELIPFFWSSNIWLLKNRKNSMMKWFSNKFACIETLHQPHLATLLTNTLSLFLSRCVFNSNHFTSRQKRHSIKICGNVREKNEAT